MRALVFDEHGDLEKLHIADVPMPTPGPAEALVEVKAAALNHLDLHTRRGIPGLKLPMPHIGGSDVAGVVAGIGSAVDQSWLGKRVVLNPALACGHCAFCLAGEQSLCDTFKIMGEHTTGGFAEYITVPASNLYAIPDNVSFSDAASVPLAFQTAWRALIGQAQLRAGETVMVLGAGGGVATAAIQIAKLAGAYVYAVTSTPGEGAAGA